MFLNLGSYLSRCDEYFHQTIFLTCFILRLCGNSLSTLTIIPNLLKYCSLLIIWSPLPWCSPVLCFSLLSKLQIRMLRCNSFSLLSAPKRSLMLLFFFQQKRHPCQLFLTQLLLLLLTLNLTTVWKTDDFSFVNVGLIDCYCATVPF